MSTARRLQLGLTWRAYAVGAFYAVAQIAVVSALGIQPLLAQEPGNQLANIEAQALPGNKVELRLTMTGDAPEPLAFTIDQPARIVLDLPDTGSSMDSRRKDINIGPLDTVLTAPANGRTRVVLNLDDMVPYDMRVADNLVLVTLGVSEADAAKAFSAQPAAASTAAASVGRSIESIDFRRTESGGGRVVVNLTDIGTPVDVRQESGRILVDFKDTTLPSSMVKRLDVLDFATPVTTVDAVTVDGSARLIIAAQGEWRELAYQSDRIFTVEVQPAADEPDIAASGIYNQDREYNGERLTLNFQDIDARAVLQLLADISGRNIVVSDTVNGNVTLRLQNVPWDQAMDIVLATKGLDMRENGNVIIVAPAQEIAAREKADLAARKEIQQLEPMFSEYLQVNYAKASDLARLIGGSANESLLSERGSVGIDDRTNTLLLQDTAERISNIRKLVSTLDIPVRQVLIESRIVVVSDDFSRELGVRWGATAVSDQSSGLYAITGSSEGTDTIVTSAIDNINNTGQPYPVDVPSLNDRYAVNLPVASPAGRLALAVLNDDYLIDMELSVVQAEGRGEVISSPRVITANQKEASIEQGVQIPYQEASSSGATSTQFKDAVLSLTVTPQITPDDRIILDLAVTKDSVGEVVSSERGSVPSIDTRSVTTQVLVNNGQTVVLGGIYETERGEFETKVPWLGDIPILGALFRTTRYVSNKSELLIFVTPKILEDGASIY